MSRTRRRDWLGRLIRDGQHGHACPEPDCDTCVIAKTRRQKPLREDITASQAARQIRTEGEQISYSPLWGILDQPEVQP